eukprot:TRINITY_DN71432_c0_g1_i1.p4 TRINITY_DN71432_c0_g1~~TRINITY_DN71432_c0_g1_i1.p4  ORF type:complete len:126 (-),score=21.72 TRINITY_DN71432_c0_g1_i1:35-412(-)
MRRRRRRLPEDEEEAVPLPSDGGDVGVVLDQDSAADLWRSRRFPAGEEDRDVVMIGSDMFGDEGSKLLEADGWVECDDSCVDFTFSVGEDDGDGDLCGREGGQGHSHWRGFCARVSWGELGNLGF